MADQSDLSSRDPKDNLAARDQIKRQLSEAEDELNREAYRLEMADVAIELAECELDELQSLSMTSLISALMGTKAGRIDAKREEIEALRRDQQLCADAVAAAGGVVEQLRAELTQYVGIPEAAESLEDEGQMARTDGDGQGYTHELEQALEAGETLLSQLKGAYASCNRLRSSDPFGPKGALIKLAVSTWKGSIANQLTGQVGNSVAYFVKQLQRLPLGPDYLPDVCTMLAQLEPFTSAAGLSAKAGSDAWVELEVVTRSIISDLEDQLRKSRT